MDSLDPVPSADYASLLTISSPSDQTKVVTLSSGQKDYGFNKISQEHIYAQVVQNGQLQTLDTVLGESKMNVALRENATGKVMPNKIFIPKTILLRSPTLSLSHSNSVPDVRRPYQNLPKLCPSNYGSLNTTKIENKDLMTQAANVDSSVFSISGRRVVVSSGFKGNSANNSKDSDSSRGSPTFWSRRSSLDGQTETKRRRLQVCTDCFSLCLFVPGTVLCILSPWLLVPIYIIPNFSGSHFQTLIWISCVGSFILVFMGCMVGNLVWYRKGEDWKCRLHCGKGPKNHYWGDSLSSRTTHIV